MYKDAEKQKEANRKAQAKRRGYDTEGMTEQGVTGMTRLNPGTMKPYGPSMAVMPDEVLSEYERKWGWYEAKYSPCPRGYVIGDILDLQHAPHGLIANLYRMKG